MEPDHNTFDLRKVTLAPSVTPAKAGVQNSLKRPDSGFRRNDDQGSYSAFSDTF
jgi:hypothetical protein